MFLVEWDSDVELLEHTIASKLIALGVNWNDEQALKEIAHEIFSFEDKKKLHQQLYSPYLRERVLAELAGLSQLMFRTMAIAAENGREVHGGEVWKAFARALYREGEALGKIQSI